MFFFFWLWRKVAGVWGNPAIKNPLAPPQIACAFVEITTARLLICGGANTPSKSGRHQKNIKKKDVLVPPPMTFLCSGANRLGCFSAALPTKKKVLAPLQIDANRIDSSGQFIGCRPVNDNSLSFSSYDINLSHFSRSYGASTST